MTTAYKTTGIKNKFKTVFYGPGWHEGTPRMGLYEEIPKIDPKKPPVKYDPDMQTSLLIYCFLQSLITVGYLNFVLLKLDSFNIRFLQALAFWIILTLFTVGKLMDNENKCKQIELFRALCGLLVSRIFNFSDFDISMPWVKLLQFVYLGSSIFMIYSILAPKSEKEIKKD